MTPPLLSRLPTIALTDATEPGEAAEMARLLLEARARRSDPATSHEAAESVLALTEKRQAVLAVFQAAGPNAPPMWFGGLADFELLEVYADRVEHDEAPPQSESGLRTRRSELVRMGALRDSGHTRANEAGRQCTVWEIVP